MDQKDLIKYGLIAIGAYLIYKYVEANGGLSAVLGTGSTTPATGTGTTANCNFTGQATVTAAAAKALGITLSAAQLAQIAACGMAVATPAQLTQLQVAAVSQKVPNPSATNPPVSNTPPPATCPGGSFVNGVCTQEPTDPISQLMVGLATSSGSGTSLDMDQWNYFYSQVTGNPSPVDPGSISPGVYAGAGIVDRTTPTDIGTWLAIMQNQSPSSGLSAFFGLGGPRYTPAWLM